MTDSTPSQHAPEGRHEPGEAKTDAMLVYEFLRQPDWQGDEFSLIDWLNSRPCQAAHRLAHPVLLGDRATPPADARRDTETAGVAVPDAWQWREIGGPWITVLDGVTPEFHTRRGYETRPLYASPEPLRAAPTDRGDGWRFDMENAPRDGVTKIDIWTRGGREIDCSWIVRRYGPKAGIGTWRNGANSCFDDAEAWRIERGPTPSPDPRDANPKPRPGSVEHDAAEHRAEEQADAAGEDRHEFHFDYRNHRGEYGRRRVWPSGVRFGSTDWHPEPQWLLLAYDLDKQDDREFAMADIGARTTAPDAPAAAGRATEAIVTIDQIIRHACTDDPLACQIADIIRDAVTTDGAGGLGV